MSTANILTDDSLRTLTGLSVWLDTARDAVPGVYTVVGVKDAHVEKALAILKKNGIKAYPRPNKGPATDRDLRANERPLRPFNEADAHDIAMVVRARARGLAAY